MSQLMEEELDAPRAPLPKTPVLITAATKWEAEPLAAALGLKRASQNRWDGSYAGREITVLKTGIGPQKTADALQAFAPKSYGLTLSAGLCGALQKEAKTGDIVADAREADLDLVKPLRETALKLALPFHFGKILHTDKVLQPPAKKALGEEQRAVACDMESAALRHWADGKTETLAVRAVLDELHEDCPENAPEGEDPAALARFALTHAAQMPRLIRTGMRSGRAMKNLTRFLKAYLETI